MITILAAGCMTCICLRMVAPSFVIVTLPSDDWIILSIPFGPKLVERKEKASSGTCFAGRHVTPTFDCKHQA